MKKNYEKCPYTHEYKLKNLFENLNKKLLVVNIQKL